MTAAPLSPPVYRLALRRLLSGRRFLALALLALLPALAAAGFAAAGEIEPELFWARLVQRLVIPTVIAFIAVVIGASAVGDEREDGTILYLASTPLPRLTIVASTIAAAWTVALGLTVPAVLLPGLIALGGETDGPLLAWPALGAALAALSYCAVAAWLAMVARRPVVIGVLYILLWEGSIATFAASADRFSIAAYGRAVAVKGVVDVNAPATPAAAAAAILVAVAALATWWAARRMGRTELP